MADKTETTASKFDMGSFDFANSACAWCHPGGGALEYDRDGYRFDGFEGGLGNIGSNPAPGNGDYFSFDPVTKALVSRQAAWQSSGVAEVDCLMCHLKTTVGGFRYSNLERNYAPPAANLKAAASLGLVGPTGTTGLLSITTRGSNGVNPNIAQSGWAWNDIGAGTAAVPAELIEKTPNKENCALCHFADKTLTTPGPVNTPLGFTAFQKVLAAGSTADGDLVAGGNNTTAWNLSKGRAEFGKRGESINDPLNPDAHMDASRGNMTCSACHHSLDGNFPAILGHSGEVLPGVTVKKIDHQFAKGNNLPDGKNMDQLDNTVTCESCHTTRTHPNLSENGGTLVSPTPGHAGFPAVHFTKISCRTCHIPEVNFVRKQTVADFTVGPYQTGERAATIFNATGLHHKPLHMFRSLEHEGGAVKIEPVTTVGVPVWVDGNGMKPTFQRLAKSVAEARRAASSDNNGDGIFDWPLNQPQGGDTVLTVNTQSEITDFVNRFQAAGVATPVMNMYVNVFDVSHNVAPLSSGKTLGSAAGGGCIMCHSSSDTASSNYTPKSYGFFDGKHTLFSNPVEADSACAGTTGGIMQTTVGGTKRVSIKFGSFTETGAAFTIDLSNVPDCTPVGNTLNTGAVLGYAGSKLSSMMNPGTAGVQKPVASFTAAADPAVSNEVDLDGSSSVCVNAPCTFAWTFGDGGTGSGTAVSHVYAASGDYSVTLTVNDALGFKNSRSQTATAGVINQAPTAAGLAAAIGSNFTVSFTDASVDAAGNSPSGIVSNMVNWGDGSSTACANGAVCTHTFAAASTYTITHTVTNAAGISAMENRRMSVPQKFSISGTVSRWDPAAGVSGVTMILKLNGATKAVKTTAADGTFSFMNILPGTYVVQPFRTGTTFTPATRTITIGPDQTAADFTAAP